MQTIRGTKDILPSEIKAWQEIYIQALHLFNLYNYHEIKTPIIENTEVFLKSVGSSTDIVSKEMYRFTDQGGRDVVLRPEGTACIARAVANNKLYNINTIQKLWYIGPMFRYERPQYGRQRQFHQLGVECIGSDNPLADAEVIGIAHTILQKLQCHRHITQINSLGSIEERGKYKESFKAFLKQYENELDSDSKKRLSVNPLRILDSKNPRTQEIVQDAPCISEYLEKESKIHFEIICKHLTELNIPYQINTKLVRGLDYYSHTAFEIVSNEPDNQKTICGGGRYNNLVKQFGGPDLPGVGWAIGIERLLLLINKNKNTNKRDIRFDIITEDLEGQKKSWKIIEALKAHNIMFNLNLSRQSLQKKIKKAIQSNIFGCIIIGGNEVKNSTVTIKWLHEQRQESIPYNEAINYIEKKIKEYAANYK